MTAAARSDLPENRAFAITRVFDAPRSLLFQAWTRKLTDLVHPAARLTIFRSDQC